MGNKNRPLVKHNWPLVTPPGGPTCHRSRARTAPAMMSSACCHVVNHVSELAREAVTSRRGGKTTCRRARSSKTEVERSHFNQRTGTKSSFAEMSVPLLYKVVKDCPHMSVYASIPVSQLFIILAPSNPQIYIGAPDGPLSHPWTSQCYQLITTNIAGIDAPYAKGKRTLTCCQQSHPSPRQRERTVRLQ